MRVIKLAVRSRTGVVFVDPRDDRPLPDCGIDGNVDDFFEDGRGRRGKPGHYQVNDLQ